MEVVERCHRLAPVLPGGAAFGELTAAELHGLWLPPLPDNLPVSVLLPPGANRIRRAGVRCRRVELAAADVMAVAGLPVTSVVRTLLDLAESLALIDLVVLGDSALQSGACSRADLEREAAECSSRGIRRLRRAISLMDARSESAWETVLRLMHVLPGLPPVEPQVDITDDDGRWLARGDLWLVGTRRVREYDGATHRSRDRHRSDLAGTNGSAEPGTSGSATPRAR